MLFSVLEIPLTATESSSAGQHEVPTPTFGHQTKGFLVSVGGKFLNSELQEVRRLHLTLHYIYTQHYKRAFLPLQLIFKGKCLMYIHIYNVV